MEPKGKGGGNVAGGNGGGNGGPDGVEGKGEISCGSGGDGRDVGGVGISCGAGGGGSVGCASSICGSVLDAGGPCSVFAGLPSNNEGVE